MIYRTTDVICSPAQWKINQKLICTPLSGVLDSSGNIYLYSRPKQPFFSGVFICTQ